MTLFKLSVEIEPLDEGGFLASCPNLQGGHVEGRTIHEASENFEDVAKNLVQIFKQEGLPLPVLDCGIDPSTTGGIPIQLECV